MQDPCVVDDEALSRIVHSRLGEAISDNRVLLTDALEIFNTLREQPAGLLKKPSTSELLSWLRILVARSQDDSAHIRSKSMIEPALSAMIKTAEDRPKAQGLLEEWIEKKNK